MSGLRRRFREPLSRFNHGSSVRRGAPAQLPSGDRAMLATVTPHSGKGRPQGKFRAGRRSKGRVHRFRTRDQGRPALRGRATVIAQVRTCGVARAGGPGRQLCADRFFDRDQTHRASERELVPMLAADDCEFIPATDRWEIFLVVIASQGLENHLKWSHYHQISPCIQNGR